MRLVVVGGYTLDDLQTHVVESFSAIRSKDEPGSYTWDQTYDSPMKRYGLPFAPSSLQKIFYIVPVKERHSISVTWQIPSQVSNWRAKPCDYLAHLIGHEGRGSLLASLKARSWVTACCAGVGDDGDENATSHALFTTSFSLSEEGVDHWQEVVSELYRYVGMLRFYGTTDEGLPLWIFEELKAIYEVSHRYADEQPPEDFAVDLAEEMSPWWNTPPDRLLDASGLLFEYDPHTINALLSDYFIPQNARIDMASASFGRSGDYEDDEAANRVDYFDYFNLSENCLPPSDTLLDPKAVGLPHIEPIFGTPFWCQELPQSVLQNWTDCAQPHLPPEGSKLSLPQKNEFVPSNFSLKPLPPSDCDHPLLNCSVKLQIPVGKRKEWFPATVTQYDGVKNQILCVYEDHDKKWHKVDDPSSELTHTRLTALDFEGTLDGKKIKYKIVSLPMEGEKAVLRYGDDSDFDVEDGKAFPPIPPASPPSRLPKLVSNTNELKLWHLQDRVFKRPIADLRLQLNCADANKSPLHSACADILVSLVLDSVIEISYMASVCDLNSSISSNESGFAVRAEGFDDKLLSLFMVVLESLLKFRNRSVDGTLPEGFTKKRFYLILESYRRSCMNCGMRARSLSSDIRVLCLRPGSFSTNQKAKAIEHIDIPTFTTTISNILQQIGAEGLYHGNVDVINAEDARDRILALLRKSGGGGNSGLARKKYPQQPVLKLIPNKPCEATAVVKDPKEPNTSVEIYFQVGKDNVRDRVMVDLLIEMMEEPLYNQIRTLDQFGYDVSCDSRWTNGVIGMHLCVVTPSKTVQETEDRIERFLLEFRQTLVDMSPTDFMENMVGLAKYKLNAFHSLSEETDQLWDEIRDGRYLWEAEREEVMCLKTLTQKAAINAYDKWLFPQSKQRMRLAVKVTASEGPASVGRCDVNPEDVDEYNDRSVQACYKFCKNQTFGRIF
jgi:secreted Zn-dependent insulinase-like peptidase